MKIHKTVIYRSNSGDILNTRTTTYKVIVIVGNVAVITVIITVFVSPLIVMNNGDFDTLHTSQYTW